MAFLSRKLLGAGAHEAPAGIERVGTAYSYQALSVGTTLTLDISGISIQNNDYLYLHSVSEEGSGIQPSSGQGFTSIHSAIANDTRSHNMNVSYVQLNGTETSVDTELVGSGSSATIHAFAVVYRNVTDPLPISGGASLVQTLSSSNDRDPSIGWYWSSSLADHAVQVMFHGHSNYYNGFENWDSTGDAQIGSKVNYEENHQDYVTNTYGSEMYFLEISNYGSGLGSSNRATGSNANTEGRDARVTVTFPIT
jgi:hypothetical protein